MLNPDNVTVAYYSPYTGTNEQMKSVELVILKIMSKMNGQLEVYPNLQN